MTSSSLSHNIERLRDLAAEPAGLGRVLDTFKVLTGVPPTHRDELERYADDHRLLETPEVQAARDATGRPALECIISGQGVGPLVLGITPEAMMWVLGQPDEDTIRERHKAYWHWRSRGLDCLFNDNQLHALFIYSGLKGGYETGEHSRFQGITPEGLDLSSSPEELLAAYGEPDKKGELSMAPVPSTWWSWGTFGVDFITATREIILLKIHGGGSRS